MCVYISYIRVGLHVYSKIRKPESWLLYIMWRGDVTSTITAIIVGISLSLHNIPQKFRYWSENFIIWFLYLEWKCNIRCLWSKRFITTKKTAYSIDTNLTFRYNFQNDWFDMVICIYRPLLLASFFCIFVYFLWNL